jgi:lipopolysaccharide assembly outer membrane protein LptD (OstA)
MRSWKLLGSCCSFLLLLSLPAQAVSTNNAFSQPQPAAKDSPMHWGGDQSTLNRKSHLVELRGNAYVIRDNEEVYADEIDLNLETHQVWARSRVRYQYGEYFVRADQIYLDLVHKTGTVTNGNVTNGHFALRGSYMQQIEPKRFLVDDFNYTTCIDCPNSWQMTGKTADVTLDQYAYMHDFILKVKDASLLWLPEMIIPVKSKRESGFLFPRFGAESFHGAEIVQPYFWAINDWSDMTFGLGDYLSNGVRMEAEGRYAITDRSRGIVTAYTTHDPQIGATSEYRYAVKSQIVQEMPYGFEGKLRLNEVSDAGYPVQYSSDIEGRYEPVLTSDLFFSNNDPSTSTVISFRRIRNLLYFEPDPTVAGTFDYKSGFDPNTVQEFPRVVVNTNDQFLFGSKIAAGVEARFNRFSRGAGNFDTLYQPDPNNPNNQIATQVVREANRFTLIPNAYTTLNPWPWLSVVPSLAYHTYLYNFDGALPNLARGYLVGQVEASVQLERFYASDDPNVTYKHTFRPTLTYSNIPPKSVFLGDSSHPFYTQVQSSGIPGWYFDDSDIIPTGHSENVDSYFTPEGNSLTYGFITEWFRKEKAKDGSATVAAKKAEFGIQQTLDIQELDRALSSPNAFDDRIVLSPVFTHLLLQGDRFSSYTEYTYYSFLDRYTEAQLLPFYSPHRISTSLTWNIENGIHQGLLVYDRSLSFNYSFAKLTSKTSSLNAEFHYSINDYFMPLVAISYNLVENTPPNQRIANQKYGFVFQSPSRCWRLNLAYMEAPDTGNSVNFGFAFNLAGNSFGGP